MNKSKWLLAGCCLMVAVLNSCEDNPGNLNPQVLPKGDLISAYQTDTTSLITSMYLKDSILTTAATNSMLGSFNDPVFGESKASIYAEVTPPLGLPTIPWAQGNAVVDSMVMLLQMDPVTPYGNNDPQTIGVYRVSDSIRYPHAYYSDTNLRLFSNTPIGEAQVIPPNSVTTSNDTFRVKLTKEFTTYFTNKVEFGGANWTTNFNTNVMQGVYITSLSSNQLPGQGGIIYVSLYNSFSGLCVYYHYLGAPADSEIGLNFPLGGTYAKYFNNFTHNYATSPIGASPPRGPRDSVAAGQLVYIQSMGGTLGRIDFPNLYENWSKKGPILVNEAVLNLPVDMQYLNFGPPQQLYVQETLSNWGTYPLPDQGLSYYGGGYTATSSGGAAYTFVITQYIQSIIDGKNDSDRHRGLYITTGTVLNANRVVLYGAKHGTSPVNKASLTIYYTPIKKS